MQTATWSATSPAGTPAEASGRLLLLHWALIRSRAARCRVVCSGTTRRASGGRRRRSRRRRRRTSIVAEHETLRTRRSSWACTSTFPWRPPGAVRARASVAPAHAARLALSGPADHRACARAAQDYWVARGEQRHHRPGRQALQRVGLEGDRVRRRRVSVTVLAALARRPRSPCSRFAAAAVCVPAAPDARVCIVC